MKALIIEELNSVEDRRELNINTASTFKVMKSGRDLLENGIILSGFFWSFSGQVVIVENELGGIEVFLGHLNEGSFTVKEVISNVKIPSLVNQLKRATEKYNSLIKAA